MVVNKNLLIPKRAHEGNMEQILSSVQHGRQLSALQMALAPDLFNQLQETNNHGMNYWTNPNPQIPKSNQKFNMEQTFPSVQHGRQLSALQMALVPDLFNQLQAINNLGRNHWTKQPHFKPAVSCIRRVKSFKSIPRLSVWPQVSQPNMNMAPAATVKIALAEEVNGKWKLQEIQQNLQSIALQS